MSDLRDARDNAWYATSTPGDSDTRVTFNRGFDAGARWAIRYSSQLSPHVAKFVELLVLLGFQDGNET